MHRKGRAGNVFMHFQWVNLIPNIMNLDTSVYAAAAVIFKFSRDVSIEKVFQLSLRSPTWTKKFYHHRHLETTRVRVVPNGTFVPRLRRYVWVLTGCLHAVNNNPC